MGTLLGKESAQGLRVRDVQNLGWNDHRQPPAGFEKRNARDDERHPGVGVFRERQAESLEHFFGKHLLLVGQVLVTDEGRVSDNRAELLLIA